MYFRPVHNSTVFSTRAAVRLSPPFPEHFHPSFQKPHARRQSCPSRPWQPPPPPGPGIGLLWTLPIHAVLQQVASVIGFPPRHPVHRVRPNGSRCQSSLSLMAQ